MSRHKKSCISKQRIHINNCLESFFQTWNVLRKFEKIKNHNSRRFSLHQWNCEEDLIMKLVLCFVATLMTLDGSGKSLQKRNYNFNCSRGLYPFWFSLRRLKIRLVVKDIQKIISATCCIHCINLWRACSQFVLFKPTRKLTESKS